MGESLIARQLKTSKMHSSVHSCDLGIVLILKNLRKLSDNEKVILLEGHIVPGKMYQFPSLSFGGHKSLFQMNWLDNYNGLTYSESENGGYTLFFIFLGIIIVIHQCSTAI